MEASLVLTCWNGRKLLEKNFPLVLKAVRNSKNRIKEILVVDDGSTDNSGQFARQFQGSNSEFEIKVITHDKNFGYARTCNTGVKEAKSELVVILNLDVIPSENFLEAALPHFEDEKTFAVSFNEEKFGPGKLIWKNGFLEIISTSVPKKTSLTDWPSGGSSVFSKKIWEELGGMDELFLPFYFEDIDLGIRARKNGYKCLWEPMAKVNHQHEATINAENFDLNFINSIKQRNHLLLTWKHIDNLNLFFSHFFNLIKKCLFHPGYLRIIYLAGKRILFR